MGEETKHILKMLNHTHFYWKIGFLGVAISGVVHLFFLFLFLYMDIPLLAAINLISVIIYWYSIYGLGKEAIETGDDSIIGWLIYLELIGHNLLATWTLGREAGFQYYLYIPAFLPFFIINYPRRIYILRTLIILTLALLIDFSPLFSSPKIPIDPASITILHRINLFIFLIALSTMNYLYAVHEQSHHSYLKANSLKDPMTGLFNRRYLQDLLEYPYSIHRNSHPYALILIDIDHFKNINDTYGHNCGDHIITHIASLLKQHTSEEVTVIRWGGDEFLLLFPAVTPKDLQELAETLRTMIQNSSVICGENSIKLTITQGIAITREDEPFEKTLQRADEALYIGKEQGRNQTVLL